MKDNKNEIKEQKLESVNVNTTQDKIVPKFCTTINIGLLKTKNVVLTMAYSEGNDNIALIERIVIDLDHAKQLNDILTKLLKEAEDVSTNSN
jgi:hypothetical protein